MAYKLILLNTDACKSAKKAIAYIAGISKKAHEGNKTKKGKETAAMQAKKATQSITHLVEDCY